MTKEEKTQILTAALDRAYRDLDATGQLTGEDSYHLIRTIGDLEVLCGMVSRDVGATPDADTAEPVKTGKVPKPAENPVEPEPDPEGPGYKMEDVRGALAAARRKGVNVAKLIQSFGVDNFALIDKSKYPEIMQKLAKEGAV